MAFSERLALLITADGAGAISEFRKVGDSAERELGKAESRSRNMAAGFTSAGVAMMGTAAVLGAGLYQAGKSAADLEQAVGGTEAVFKDTAGTIDEFASSADTMTGLSETAARTLTTRLGGALKGLGFDTQAAADQAVNLTKVAADLAATYGGTTSDAVEALSAAFRGEFDPAEQFNLFLKQSTVDAKAVEMGLAATTSQVDAHARAQATLALVMEQSADASGQFARESGTVAGQMAIATAQWENAKAELGAGFMPMMAKAAGAVSSLTSGFSSLDSATNGTLSTFIALGTAGLGVAGAVSVVAGQAMKAKEKFAELRESTMQWTATRQTIAGVGTAVLSVAAVAATLWGELDKINKAAEGMGKSFTQVGKEKMLNGGLDAVNNQLDVMGQQMAKLKGEVDQWEGTNNPFEKVFGALERDANAALYNEIEKSKAELIEFQNQVRKVADEQDISEESAIQWVMGLKGAGEAADDTKGRHAALASITEELAGAFDAADKALQAWVHDLHGTADAQSEAEAALDDLLAKQQENMLSMDLNTSAGRDNLSLVEDLQAAALAYGAEVYRTTGSVDQATAAAQSYIGRAQAEIAARYGNTTAVQTLNGAMALTPEQVHTAFTTSGLDEAIAKTREWARLLVQDVGAAMQRIGMRGAQAIGGARAEGGPVAAGTSYLVGERGPEIFTPGASGAITPNHALGGGGGSQTIVLQVGTDVLARFVVDAMNRAEGAYG